MSRSILVAGLLAALALPAAAENPVSDHADLWDKVREGTRGGDEGERSRAGREPERPAASGEAGSEASGAAERPETEADGS